MKSLSVLSLFDKSRSGSADGATNGHWRSFEQLAGTESHNDEAANEFAHGQDEAPTDASRRDALKVMGASLALAGASSACVRRPEETILPYTKQPEQVIPGVANYYATSYPSPHGAVGIVVESHEGRPTKVEGNPDHPGSQGRTDLHMQAHVLELYDPDRSRHPMQAGKDATWAAWDSSTVPAIMKTGNVAVLHDGSYGPTFERLAGELKKNGASFYTYEPLRWDVAINGAEMVFGNGAQISYDLEKAEG